MTTATETKADVIRSGAKRDIKERGAYLEEWFDPCKVDEVSIRQLNERNAILEAVKADYRKGFIHEIYMCNDIFASVCGAKNFDGTIYVNFHYKENFEGYLKAKAIINDRLKGVA